MKKTNLSIHWFKWRFL